MAHVFESIAEHPVAWGESDIDEMLAEYLLEDDAEETEVTLAFNNLEQVRKGSRVSPEHSEDGNMPPIADATRLHNSFETGTAPNVPNPLFFNASDGFRITQQTPTNNPALEVRSPILSSREFLIDEKELADAVSKAMEVPLHAPLPITPFEKKAAKRRRMEPAPTTAVQRATVLPSSESQLVLSTEPAKTTRRKDCPVEHERRRERNRVLARKKPPKEKSLFETLQKEVARLNHHNQIMREIITTKMGVDDLDRILEKYAPQADDDSVDQIMDSASVSGSDSD